MTTATIEKSAAKIVPPAEWLAARKQLLAKEKEFTRLRDDLSRQRREMPWEKVEKKYVFEGVHGKETLADMFDGRSQLIVYHFMLGPGWKEGCPSCSYLADSFDAATGPFGAARHYVCRCFASDIAGNRSLQEAMGWQFKWVSSFGSDFNYDYHVSFTKEEVDSGKMNYNYSFPGISFGRGARRQRVLQAGKRGLSTRTRRMRAGSTSCCRLTICWTYSEGPRRRCFAFPMAWVRHHDRYGNPKVMDAITVLAGKPCCSEESK